MKAIARAAALAGIAMAVGIALGVLGFGMHGRNGPSGADPTTIVMLFGFAVWIIVTLMIGQALPRRRRAAMISRMTRKRTVVTAQLKQLIVAAYIGDGQPSIREVSQRLACSYGTVHRVLTEAGAVRPRGITRAARARKAATA